MLEQLLITRFDLTLGGDHRRISLGLRLVQGVHRLGETVLLSLHARDELTVTLRDMFGLRLRSGSTLAVLPYSAATNSGRQTPMSCWIIEQSIDRLIPGARPVVLDARRGKKFTLRSRKNRRNLDDAITGEVARYVSHRQAAALASPLSRQRSRSVTCSWPSLIIWPYSSSPNAPIVSCAC
ncbi:MAG: hypothetical protein GEV28_11725 [Actinophytocola sp.]|uniref:hypothetical protein n=1 Tax=Actinophytocola sp. TaxID=1872138 RepID=UPI0013278019|nr:hypothetical protein [Actinophytocola sp.]MPZ81022.1 hypothetical protein [Actinophytocola sp.]